MAMDMSSQAGLTLRVMFQSNRHRQVTVEALRYWAWPAIAHGQIMFAFDNQGDPIAFWTWALVASDVEDRLRSCNPTLLHECEWNEGDSLWITDFVALRGSFADVVARMRCMYPTHASANFSRPGRQHSVHAWTHETAERLTTRDRSSRYRLPATAFARSYEEWCSLNRSKSTQHCDNSKGESTEA